MTTRRIDPTEPNRVPAEGPEDARVMLIGEAPGETEVKQRRPFVGLAGKGLNDMLAEAGLARGACYLTNVVKYRPAGNKFANFYETRGGKKCQSARLVEGIRELQEEIVRVSPNVIVPLGNEAMKAVLGFGGVTDYRGSILSSKFGKTIPTIHPSAVLRNWSYRSMVVSDLTRAWEESGSPEIRISPRELVVTYNSREAINELKRIRQDAKEVAFDIETESDQVTCISFADRRDRSVCIPFWFGGSGSLHDKESEATIWALIEAILGSTCIGKIAHNGAYDIGFLRRVYGITTRNYVFDTMVGMHSLYLELPKSLAFATSVYTDQPYYKYMRKTDSMDTHFDYNAMDSCVTFEIAEKLRADMADSGVLDFYRDYMHPLITPLLEMELRGVRFDTAKRNSLRTEYRDRLATLQHRLDELVGHELNTASHPQMTKWLYTELKYPRITKLNKVTGSRGLTADNDALEKCRKKEAREELDIVLEIRELSKVYSTYLGVKLDDDKRIRCSYNLTGTETGRLSSSQTARGTGTNLQNIPEGVIKGLFIPDEGKVFINADLSQAEARVVAYLSNEDRLIRVFEEGGDIHRKNAANIFNITEGEVSDEQRQMAKRVVHACVTGEHEVLTKEDGWIQIKDYAKQSIAIWGEDNKIHFEVPKFHAYDGVMNLYEVKGTSLSAVCTPEHGWPVVSSYGDTKYVVKRETQNLPLTGRIPLTGEYYGHRHTNHEHLRLVVATQADGHITEARGIRFHLKKERKITRLKEILGRLNYHYMEGVCKDGSTTISISPKRCANVIKHFVDYEKTFSLQDLLSLNTRYRQTFLNELPYWDGEISNKEGRQTAYYTTNVKNAKIVQTVAHLTGSEALLNYSTLPSGKILCAISFNARRFARIEKLSINQIKTIPQKVYCFTTSTGYFLLAKEDENARRRICISGNSNYGMGPRTFATQTGIVESRARRLLNQYFATYPRIKVWHMHIQDTLRRTRQLTTPYGRKRVFFNRWSDSLYKEGLAYIPQSTVADLLNQGMLCLARQWEDRSDRELLLQVHDSVLVQCDRSLVSQVVKEIRECLERPLEINGKVLVIPSDFKVGKSWGEMSKYIKEVRDE